MLRPIKSGYIQSRLIGYTATTAASAVNTIQNGVGEGTFTNASQDDRLDLTFAHPFAQKPVQVCGAGNGIADGGVVGVFSDSFPSATATTTEGVTGAAGNDLGTHHSLIWGVDAVQTRRSGNKLGKLFPVRGSKTQQVMYAGLVTSAGALSVGPSRNVSVTKNGTGDYTLSLDPGFGRDPVVLIMPFNAVDGVSGRAETVTENSVNVLTFNSADSAADTGFNFMILGSHQTQDYARQKGGEILTPLRRPRLIGGSISNPGGSASIDFGTGDFTLVDNGAGDYTITFDEPFEQTPVVIGEALTASSSAWVSAEAQSSTAVTLNVAIQTGSAFDTAQLSFLVLGSDSSDTF
jgi:hypothetical protein